MSSSPFAEYEGEQEIITLDPSKELENSKIVEDFIFEIRTKNFILDLNHEYKDKRVIWHYNKNWTIMKSSLIKECKKKGVKDEHIPHIENTVDLNYNNITATQENYYNNDNDQQKQEQESEEERMSLSQKLVEPVLKNYIKLFKDEFNVPHIVVMINNYYQTLPIDSTKFKRYLKKLYFDTYEGRIANTEAINSAVSQLEAKAFYEGETIPLYLRVAWSNPDITDTIYYDLSDEKNRCVKITKDGWEIVEN